MDVPTGDPAAIRQLAVRLRLVGQDMAGVLARAQDRSSLPRTQGAVADRFRDAMWQRRERGDRLGRRIDLLANDLDRTADWLEQVQYEAALERVQQTVEE